MKGARVLVVSLRGVNFRFWSRLRCSGQNTLYLAVKVSFRVAREEILNIIFSIHFIYSIHVIKVKMIALRSQKKVRPRPNFSPSGVNSQFPTRIPSPFRGHFSNQNVTDKKED